MSEHWQRTLLDVALLTMLVGIALFALQMAKTPPVPAGKGTTEPAYSWMAYLVLGWISFWAIVVWAAFRKRWPVR
jgi:uncharacterized membrane protein